MILDVRDVSFRYNSRSVLENLQPGKERTAGRPRPERVEDDPAEVPERHPASGDGAICWGEDLPRMKKLK